MKISIIGVGIYSTALALKCAQNKHKIMMWTENAALEQNFKLNHNLESITPTPIPINIDITTSFEACLKDTELIIIGTTAKYVREVTENLKAYYNSDIPICLASKGIENDTCLFLSDTIKEILQTNNVSVISGPTFAIDIINNNPCALTLGTTSKIAETSITKALASNLLKIRPNNDLIGTEICGSIKNVIAIASGIIEGLGYHESTNAFLLTEALHDIKEILAVFNCNPKTILSYAGVGDLMLTCSSPKSRNYKYGLLLGEKKNQQEIDYYLKNNTTEGYYTLISINKLFHQKRLSIPLIDIIYNIAFNNKEPETLINYLINKN